jgi:hypothetical protein
MIVCGLLGKISLPFNLKNKLCGISNVALVICIWLMFKLDFSPNDISIGYELY